MRNPLPERCLIIWSLFCFVFKFIFLHAKHKIYSEMPVGLRIKSTYLELLLAVAVWWVLLQKNKYFVILLNCWGIPY